MAHKRETPLLGGKALGALGVMVMLCGGGCMGSYWRSKPHLMKQRFIPLRHIPRITPLDQAALSIALPEEYVRQRRLLEEERRDLGPFGPLPISQNSPAPKLGHEHEEKRGEGYNIRGKDERKY